MRLALLVVLFLFLIRLVIAETNVSILGGPVIIKGGYMDLGTTVLVSTTPAPGDNAGHCIGILCGVTYN